MFITTFNPHLTNDHLHLTIGPDLVTSFGMSPLLIGVLVLILLVALLLYRKDITSGVKDFEIDQAEFGLGDQKITLRPNNQDRQIAYKIWVELSTRKIGLEIDLADDVIAEIYDSWYHFFSVTRELIKDVPVTKFRRRGTEEIIRLSIDVLNLGIRPHLTRWQARFRRWYERQLMEDVNAELHPQDIQREFPDFEELKKDMLTVNARLKHYRESMYNLVTSL